MNKTLFKVLVFALGLLAMGTPSQAALTAVDPGPYTAGTGFFPVWYEDTTDLQLEICLSQTIIPAGAAPGLVGGPACLLNPPPEPPPPPQLPFDPALPVVFPFNFPDEAFWATADATINGGTVIVEYVSALEAAFAGGPVLDGDQVSFARIRIRVEGLPATGIYTITHPFGVDTFDVQDISQKRDINFTEDRGIGRPGTFGGALAGRIGPFLQRVGGLITVTDPVTGATEQFIGDPNTPEPVTGSPFGTNFVRIQGPGVNLTTNLFNVSGKVFGGAMPTELTMQRSTYKRTAAGATSLEVFAGSTQPDATLSFRETIAKVPVETSMNTDGAGNYFGQDLAPPTLPPFVVVTAVSPPAAGVITPTPTSLASQVVDVVKIHQAQYSLQDDTLVIEASSSDEQIIPTLRVVGLPGTLQIVSGTTTQQLVVNGVVEPPATVTVKSSAGGADTEPVAVVEVANANPIAVNDSREMLQGTAQLVIDVLTNDSDPDDPQNLNPLTVANLTQPATGTGSATTDGTTVTYSPPDATFTGTATFTYQAQDSRGGLSNVATVTVTVRLPNRNPVANPDTATTPEDTPVTIPVLANDTDPDGNPLTVTAVSNVVNGTAVISGASVVFTPSPNFNGNAGFNYTVSDGQGGTATGTVTVTVTPVNDPPVANADTATTPEDTPVPIPLATLLANDTDVDGDARSVTAVGNPVNGTVLNDGTNAVFTPALNFNGTATFSYTISDGNGGTATATVSVTVTPENDAPVANADAATATSGVAATIPVLANDTDVDSPVLVVGTVTQGANGSVVNNGANVIYTPNAGFTGTDSFSYQASDGSLLSNPATVTVTVTAVALDLDIQQFQTTNNVRIGRGESVAITLRVRNQSAVNVGAPARVVGTLNGNVVYDQSLTVTDPPGGGTTSFNFPAFTPNAQQVGTINWVATINDTNPDVDTATATSRIRP